MGKDRSLLTKVAKGIAYGDVSNASVRNVLTEVSKRIGGSFTEQEMQDSLDYFNWKCPYTGRDLRTSIEQRDGSYVTDHIAPQNQEGCGLNLKGNLVIVDRKANDAKRSTDIETFLLTDTKVLGSTDMATRKARLAKIRQFQKDCGCDTERVRLALSALMQQRYEEVRRRQEQWIEDCLAALAQAGVPSLPAPTAPVTAAAPAGKKARKGQTELIFYPADEAQFKAELLRKKAARFVLTYSDGAVKHSPWRATDLSADSNLRGNIQSKTFWRKKATEGLVKVEVYID